MPMAPFCIAVSRMAFILVSSSSFGLRASLIQHGHPRLRFGKIGSKFGLMPFFSSAAQ